MNILIIKIEARWSRGICKRLYNLDIPLCSSLFRDSIIKKANLSSSDIYKVHDTYR